MTDRAPTDKVADALQAAWDDFVQDTGCFPDAFLIEQGHLLHANFDRGNFAAMVTQWLKADGVTF